MAVDSEDKIKKRLMLRNGWTEEQALDRIRCQMPLSEKVERADVVVNNSGNFDDLRQEFVNNSLKQIVACLKSEREQEQQ